MATESTSESLLQRLGQAGGDSAWNRFVRLYTPLLFHWSQRLGLNQADAADLVQDVFALLLVKLPEFKYDSCKSFRSWLHTVMLNKWRSSLRGRVATSGGAALDEVANSGDPDPAVVFEEAEYRRYVLTRAMQIMESQFEETTWRACWEHTIMGRPAVQVAAELGISEGAVYVATHRVLRRLREELRGLLD